MASISGARASTQSAGSARSRVRAAACSMKVSSADTLRALLRLAGLVDQRGAVRADAGDLDDHLLVLRAVVVNLIRVMNDKAALGHGCRRVAIPLRAGADPPGPLDHDDLPLLRMKVGWGHRPRSEPHADHVRAGRRRTALQDCELQS